MEPLEQTLMRLIKASPSQIGSFRQLSRQLDMGADGRREVRAVLNGMVKAGLLLKLKGNRYTVPSRQSLVTGRISVHRDGYGLCHPGQAAAKTGGRCVHSRQASGRGHAGEIRCWPPWSGGRTAIEPRVGSSRSCTAETQPWWGNSKRTRLSTG